jgi:hypothetical protein
MYNFNKTSHDANWREFKQPLFRKGQRHLLCLITRKTQQKNQNDIDKDRIQYKTTSMESVGKSDNRILVSSVQHLPAIDPLTSNPSNGDLIALIFELQNKLYHMESRMSVLEEHLFHCPNYAASVSSCDGRRQDETLRSSPRSSLNFPTQTFREGNYQPSMTSTRQNSENGSQCSELGSLLTTRSRSTTFSDKVQYTSHRSAPLLCQSFPSDTR